MWLFGCFGGGRKRKSSSASAFSRLRSSSPDCRCSCHRKVIATCDTSTTDLQNQEGFEPAKNQSVAGLKSGSKTLEKNIPKRILRPTSLIMDIIYVTERIIVLTFPESASQATYKSNLKEVAQMLTKKHQNKFRIFNLSERRTDLSHLGSQVFDFGWPQGLAPPLERLCGICKAMDTWLLSDPQHIIVLHSKGDKGRIGVVIAAYMHYSSICASADQALDRFAMKKVCDDKLSKDLNPSQKRYINYFSGLLSGGIKMNNNSLFLHHILVHNLPSFENKGCRPFIKVYVGMQPVYTSGVYLVSEKSSRLVLALQPSLQLRGDILIKCYHKQHQPPKRTSLFRLQFHTCTVENSKLVFYKPDLDPCSQESKLSSETKVELQFSYMSDDYRTLGRSYDAMIPVENVTDSLVRWDSYETFDIAANNENEDEVDRLIDYELEKKVHYTEGPLDGSLYATVAKKKGGADNLSDADGPHLSMDSGISSGPQGSPTLTSTPSLPSDGSKPSSSSSSAKPPTKDEQAELDQLLFGMLRDIQSIPDLPQNRKSQVSSPTSIVSNLPSTPHNSSNLSSSSTLPMSFRNAYSPPPLPYVSSKSAASSPFYNTLGSSPGLRNGTWLQKQQEKLKAKKEGKDWEDRAYKEQRLLAELKDAQSKIVLQRQESPSLCLTQSPSPTNFSCITPLHINITSGGPVSTSSPTSSGRSAPASPLIPNRSSSKDITKQRYQFWQNTSRTLQRQNSDTSNDRGVIQSLKSETSSAFNSPQTAPIYPRSFVYPSPISRTDGLLTLLGEVCPSNLEDLEQSLSNLQSPSSTSTLAKDGTISSQWSNGSSISSPLDRPMTPAFPNTPGTPYVNREPSFIIRNTTKSPTRKDYSPSSSPINGTMSPTMYSNHSQRSSFLSLSDASDILYTPPPLFVKDTSKYWYKPTLSREQAIDVLKDLPAGSFLVRDSNSFPGAFGLALKVSVPPSNIKLKPKVVDDTNELVRHFLIEPTTKGVRLKGATSEPVFGSLVALIYQHSLTPISLPCKLQLPDSELIRKDETIARSITPQAASCNVLFLNTVDIESLTGPQAIRKALGVTLNLLPPVTPIMVSFKVTSQGIILTDKNHKLFFRRHYAISSISHCGLDPDSRLWTSKDNRINSGRCFGFVARKTGSRTDNQCHLFVELEPDQPASNIVSFVAKIMMVRSI